MKKHIPSKGKKKPTSHKSRLSVGGRSQKAASGHARSDTLTDGKTGQGQPQTSGTTASTFRMDSRPKRYIPIAAIVIILGITSLYLYVGILLRLHNYYTLIFVVPLYGYIFADLFMWLRAGVRSLEMDSTGLRVTVPNQSAVRHIGKNEIGSVRISSTVDGKTVYILLHGAKTSKFLWMNFYSGPRVRIPEAPFSKIDFAEFIDRLGTLATVTR
jgi:hypothetical protein